MQSNIHKKNRVLSILLLTLLAINCKGKSDLENQITITINSIDSKTKQARVNTFDTIEVRKEEFGLVTKAYNKISEYVTDSTGLVKITIDHNVGYRFMLKRKGFYGSESFAKPFTNEKLKDGQEINMEVTSIGNK